MDLFFQDFHLIVKFRQRSPGIKFHRYCSRRVHTNTTHPLKQPDTPKYTILQYLFSWTLSCFHLDRMWSKWYRLCYNWKPLRRCFLSNLLMTMNLNVNKEITCITAYHVCAVSQVWVVELVIVRLNKVLVAYTNRQPVAWVLIDSKSNCTAVFTFLLQRRLQKTQMVIVGFSWLDNGIWNNVDSSMLKLRTEFEANFVIKNGRVVWEFLQSLKAIFQDFVDFLTQRSGKPSSTFVKSVSHPFFASSIEPDLLLECKDFDIKLD